MPSGGLLARLDALVTRERVRNYSLIFGVLTLGALVVNTVAGGYPVTRSGNVVTPDYLAHWTGGRLLLDGRATELYDPAVQSALQHAAVPGSTGLSWFVSPPVAAGPYAVLALLPYGASALVWTAITAALLVFALTLVRPWVAEAGRRDVAVLAVVFLGSPATLELLGAGQDSAVALVLLLGGLRLLAAGRPGTAGLVLALGIFKPQLFALVPLVLLLQRSHRALAGFAVGVVGLVALTLPLVGVRGWQAWWAALESPLYQQHVQVGQTWKMQSISSLGTALGAPAWTAYAVFALGAVVLALLLRRGRGLAQTWAITVLTTVVFSPHVMSYDLVLLLPAAAYTLGRVNSRAIRLSAVLTTALVGSIGLRYLLSELGSGWPVLAAPWSALGLLAIWLVLARAPAEQSPGPRPTAGTSGSAVRAVPPMSSSRPVRP